LKGDFMDERNQIIVNEIKKWQENKLLPETYCQFLLSLYMEGNQKTTEETIQTRSYRSYVKKGLLSFLMMVLLICAIVFVMYFTQLSAGIQVIVLIGFLGISLMSARFYHLKQSPFAHLYVVLGSFISFISTVVVIDFWSGNNMYLGAGIILLCLVWILVGWRYRYHYLYIAGATGILLFIALLLVERI